MLEHSKPMMKTLSLSMPIDVHKRFKTVAVQLGVPMKDLLMQVVERMIETDIDHNQTILQ